MLPALIIAALTSIQAHSATWVCEDASVRFELDTVATTVFMEAPAVERRQLEVSSFTQQEGCEPCLDVYATYVQNPIQRAYFHLLVDDVRLMDGWIRGHELVPWKPAYTDVPCTLNP